MPNYQNGKVYKLYAQLDDGTIICYYGSTTKNLRVRLAGHVQSAKKIRDTTSKHIIDAGNYNIMLLENFPCNSKEELSAREQFYILNNECVNKVVPLRTKKEWYNDNIESIKDNRKICYSKNCDHEKEYSKQYYEQHLDQIKDRMKLYYEQNVDKLKDKAKQYYEQHSKTLNEYKRKQYQQKKANKSHHDPPIETSDIEQTNI
jgi:hypothetical protein